MDDPLAEDRRNAFRHFLCLTMMKSEGEKVPIEDGAAVGVKKEDQA